MLRFIFILRINDTLNSFLCQKAENMQAVIKYAKIHTDKRRPQAKGIIFFFQTSLHHEEGIRQ